MKKLFLIGILIGCMVKGYTQSPVSFDYKVKKLDKMHYEISIVASISRPWHLYSQYTMPPVLPTTIRFTKNPVVELKETPVEQGDLVTRHDEVFDVDVKYYAGKVAFVQQVTVKSDIKTNLAGTIEYMVCTDEKCLKPAPEKFSVKLE